jgi:hypothetical protein
VVTNERYQLLSYKIQIRTILRGYKAAAMRYVVLKVDKQLKSLLLRNAE